jgi:hypothetical protein
MVCPGTSGWQSHGSRLFNAMANIKNFAAQGRKYHAQGLLNTDWGDFGHRNFLGTSLLAFAYGAAQSWNGRAVHNKNFADIFCFHFFNQKTNKLSKSLKLLGSSYITSGLVKNKCLLYHTLVAPTASEKFLKIAKTAGLKKIIKQLSAKNLWPKSTSVKNEFERLAIEEFKLAAQMDVLAAKRTLQTKGIKTDLSKTDMHKMANQFKKLWLARNKPSRLQDNLNLFDVV